MSNDLQSIAAAMQLNNYVSVTIPTVIVYDYIITLPREINYIWSRPWTWISTLFLVIRYVGILVVVIEGLYGSSFIPGPKLVCFTLLLVPWLTSIRNYSRTYRCIPSYSLHALSFWYIPHRCTVLIIVAGWAFVLFLAAADLVMILRLHAMYRRSKIVLGVLLFFYVPTIILLAVATGYYENPNTYMLVTISQVFDTSYCNVTWTSLSKLNSYVFIPRFILAGLMFILTLARFFLESYRSSKATKQWLSSRYINLLVRENVLYFLAHLLYSIDADVITAQLNPLSLQAMMMDLVSYILLFTLCPRFIMSVRELYASDTRLKWERESGVDTGFGFTAHSSVMDVVSIRFADTEVGTTVLESSALEIQMAELRMEC
ncbi:hypothetical protein L210DRAFT_3755748 [Boletus edulis BED1]|uniref:DUF6533 domain-containing protein n=1 Tax=Boletus edulis BED1 TaxID=1328754 RepID=A0AAD4C9F2_BOLED|nr:hypothetical protein L210DRAFT_3755748 [Boletus edulis BED1]